MNYRHIYHAGIFADVVKHAVLVELVTAMQRKEKGFCYVDTHAGIGRYDLRSVEAQKTREYESGIAKVLMAHPMPKELQKYLEIVREFNLNPHPNPLPQAGEGTGIKFYPGSPCIVRELLRSQDRMIVNELHPDDSQLLKQEFKNDKQVAIHQRDAYEFLRAILPPLQQRALVLIDPAYEQEDELDQLLDALKKVLRHFSQGVYAIWLPIKDSSYEEFYSDLKIRCKQDILIAELTLAEVPEQAFGLMGCAMIIINPPYQVADVLKLQLEWLWRVWTGGTQGRVMVDIL